MSRIKPTQKIYDVVKDIKEDRFRLPSIQRSFVWEEERIHIQDVEEDLPYNDVLEVFVRVNSGGIVLTKSDLLFSTVILHSPEMEKKFIEVVDELNGNGEYDFDTDFLIKSSFVILG